MKKAYLIIGLAAVIGLLWAGHGASKKPTHLDRFYNEVGCGGCHRGTGVPGSPLLKNLRHRLCFNCHGSLKTGRRGEAMTDIETLFYKRYVHPILETSKLHYTGEELPELDPSVARHVACADCHKAHRTVPEKPWQGARGHARGRYKLKKLATQEYELCYLCHSESANLPEEQTDKSWEFDPLNLSFHPIEAKGANHFMPSLTKGLNVASRITCGDCHGNDEPDGPLGPHSSNIEHMLVAEYRQTNGPETSLAYALCYMCHERDSILKDDSFARHKMHIVFNSIACFTCHETHGSKDNKHLINFNLDMVEPSSTAHEIRYSPEQRGKPRCYLECHNRDHSYEFVAPTDLDIVNATKYYPWPW